MMTSASGWATISTSGPVFGTWSAESIVVINGPTYVPRGHTLVIEPGVRLLFKTADPFIVLGTLNAIGTAEMPIVVDPVNGWRGFSFENPDGIITMNWVEMAANGGLAISAVTCIDTRLRMNHCDLRAEMFGLRVSRGQLWADNNMFLTVGLYSHTVVIDNLANFNPRDCGDSESDHFRSNMVRAIVPYDTVRPGPSYTGGLAISGSTEICLLNNTIVVQAPGEATGACFTLGDGVGNGQIELEHCTVTVHGLKGAPKGIVQANSGELLVERCTIDVLDEMGGSRFTPVGIFASVQGAIRVFNSEVQLGMRGEFFYPWGGGDITADYLVTWHTPQTVLDDPVGPSDQNRFADLEDHLHLGPHITNNVNPNFRLEGVWGEWTSPEQAQLYYSIVYPSPCIDAGDTLYGGFDPDGTLPDIGHYYFDQASTGSADRPVYPANLTLSAPYPNPFNSSVTIPLSLEKNGRVDVRIYDILGREVANLNPGLKTAGEHRIPFTAKDLATGLYVVSVRYNGQIMGTKPIFLIR